MTARRHHYVPQFYLRYFLWPGQKTFWVYDKDGGQPRPQTPINTTVEFDFYAIDHPRDSRLEELLQQIEDRAKPILDRWQMNGATPEVGEIAVIAEFLAVQ